VFRQQGLDLGSGHPMLPASASPLKTLMNLTTSVDSLAFNPDTQVRPPRLWCRSSAHKEPFFHHSSGSVLFQTLIYACTSIAGLTHSWSMAMSN
jgi:hypothetical protein